MKSIYLFVHIISPWSQLFILSTLLSICLPIIHTHISIHTRTSIISIQYIHVFIFLFTWYVPFSSSTTFTLPHIAISLYSNIFTLHFLTFFFLVIPQPSPASCNPQRQRRPKHHLPAATPEQSLAVSIFLSSVPLKGYIFHESQGKTLWQLGLHIMTPCFLVALPLLGYDSETDKADHGHCVPFPRQWWVECLVEMIKKKVMLFLMWFAM